MAQYPASPSDGAHYPAVPGSGGGTPVVVDTTVAGLGDGAADGAIGIIRLGTWPDTHDTVLTWNEAEEKWIGEDQVLLTTNDQWAMNLLNRTPANMREFSVMYSPVPYGIARTLLNGAQAANSATITVDDTTSFPAAGVIRVGASNVTYTGKTGTTFTGCTGGAAVTYPDDWMVTSSVIEGGYGTTGSSLLYAEALWNSGLRLQENVNAWMNGSYDNFAMTIAPYYYQFDEADTRPNFAIPPTGGLGFGTALTGPAAPLHAGAKVNERPFEFVSSGWVAWGSASPGGYTAVGAPTKDFLLPYLYGKMNTSANDTGEAYGVTVRIRWVSQ